VTVVRVDDGGVVRLLLRGELDLAAAEGLSHMILHEISGFGRVVVDLDGLRFCDSTGVEILLAARDLAREHGAELTVTHPRGIVRRVLRATGAYEELTGPTAKLPVPSTG
jgi:anti-anti-sigma factor